MKNNRAKKKNKTATPKPNHSAQPKSPEPNQEAQLDEALRESFPASDPPSITRA